jgi:predicted nucleic acid-binding protein
VTLVDTSVWIEHLRFANWAFAELLNAGEVLVHPFVIGELALGNLRQRVTIVDALSILPRAIAATDEEVLHFIERNRLFGRGIGYVDAHLLAAIQLTPGTGLWTHDKRLQRVAKDLGIGQI